uniref:Uncharacterized protein n=1 Tax=Picea glauca TaxID=3330 RepID=A0A117NFL2_PICGL|nr:hypothetical protein ABT39_MTgene3423 [Picea glauca]
MFMRHARITQSVSLSGMIRGSPESSVWVLGHFCHARMLASGCW